MRLILLFLLFVSSCKNKNNVLKFTSGENGVLSSAHPLASQAGIKILKKGGNAFDAAVASAFVLSVVEPSMSGIGGRLQAIIKLPNGEVKGIDASTQVPEKYNSKTHPKNTYGYSTIGIPGVVAGLVEINKKYGKLPLNVVMRDAMHYAENGFKILPGESYRQSMAKSVIEKFSGTKKYFLNKNGKNFRPGELFIQKDLAKTLKVISQNGKSGFYEGEIAKRMVEDIQSKGGIITLDDLKNYDAKESKILRGNYRGYDVFSLYLPSYGAITIEILNIMSYFAVDQISELDWVNMFSDIFKVAYLDRPKQMNEDSLKLILSKDYAFKLFRSLKNFESNNSNMINKLNGEWLSKIGHTTHLSASDKEGNVIALTQTIGPNMGSKVVTNGLGFLYAVTLGGYLGDYKPGDRANSHISPTILTKKNGFYLAIGAAGGSRIITSITQVISNVIDKKMGLDDSLEKGRIFNVNDTVELENHDGISWDLDKKTIPNNFIFIGSPARFGRIHAVMYDTINQQIYGAADPDWEGAVYSY